MLPFIVDDAESRNESALHEASTSRVVAALAGRRAGRKEPERGPCIF